MVYENLRNKEWLKEQIEILGSQRAVARAFGIGKSVVSKWARVHGLSAGKKATDKPYKDPEWLKAEYRKGRTTVDIAAEFGVHRSSIDETLRINGIKTDDYKAQSIPYRNKEWLQKEFEECGSGVAIAKKHGYDKHTIYQYLREFNISKRRINSVDENYFEIIDTEEKAYWLGFLMADGYMKTDHKADGDLYYTAVLKLQRNDEDCLIKYLNSIKSDAAIIKTEGLTSRGNKTYSSAVSISNQKFCKDLVRHGIVPNKTGTESIPETVPSELMNHFIRGFLDGDGSIRYQPKGNKILRGITFTSSLKICEDLKNIFKNIVSDEESIRIYEHINCWTLGVYRKNEIPKIVEYLYENATIYMNRKYEVAKNYMSQ